MDHLFFAANMGSAFDLLDIACCELRACRDEYTFDEYRKALEIQHDAFVYVLLHS
jgi:hypothetical protein